MWGFFDFLFFLILVTCIVLPIVFSIKRSVTTSQKAATVLAIFAPCYVICSYILSSNIYSIVRLFTIPNLTYYSIAQMIDSISKLLLCVMFFRIFLRKVKMNAIPYFFFFGIFGIPIFWDFLIKLYQTILQYYVLDDILRDMLNELINIPLTIIYANVSFFVTKRFIYNYLEYTGEFTTKTAEYKKSLKIALFTPIVCVTNLFLKPVINYTIIYPAGLTKVILYTDLFGFISDISYLIICAVIYFLFNKKYSIKLPIILFLIPPGIHYALQPFFDGLINLIYINIKNTFHYSTVNNITYVIYAITVAVFVIVGYFITRNIIRKHVHKLF